MNKLKQEIKELENKLELKNKLLTPEEKMFQKTIKILEAINRNDPEFKKVIKILSDGIGYMEQIGTPGQVDIVRFDSL